MFADNKNISLIGVDNDHEVSNFISEGDNYLPVGVALNKNFNYNKINSWDQVFYDQANIEFDLSWSNFMFYKPSSQIEPPQEKYAFVCDSGSYGAKGVDESIISNNILRVYNNNGLLFDNMDVIQNAYEIHMINSAYIHLIDRIQTPQDTKLFYHKNFVKKPYSDFTLKKNWTII